MQNESNSFSPAPSHARATRARVATLVPTLRVVHEYEYEECIDDAYQSVSEVVVADDDGTVARVTFMIFPAHSTYKFVHADAVTCASNDELLAAHEVASAYLDSAGYESLSVAAELA